MTTPAPATVRGWLAERRPAAPEALRARVEEALGAALDRAACDAAPACLDAAERTLAAVLASGATTRASALDLLAADALVTYALEAAADDPAALGRIAGDAMRRLGALGDGAR